MCKVVLSDWLDTLNHLSVCLIKGPNKRQLLNINGKMRIETPYLVIINIVPKYTGNMAERVSN
jgi:hypothetical protein